MRYFNSIIIILMWLTLGALSSRALLAKEMEEDAAESTANQPLLENSVVMIRSVSQENDYLTPWKQGPMSQGAGSAFVIDGNYLLTNAHNVSNNKYVEIRKQNFAKRYPAGVAFIGHDCDLAVLRPEDQSFFDDMEPLVLGGIPKVNSTVSTYGFPIGGRQISVTEGVVSRIEMEAYSHTGADSHLVIQTDAAINPGNSGGPVMQDGKVVGVAFQGLRSADNIGYLIPVTVIRHFLADIEDGRYNGFGSLGVSLFAGLHSESYRDYLKVPATEDGVVVTKTLMHSSAENLIRPGDVITEIDGFNVDNDGMIRIHGLRLHMSEAVEVKQIGQSCELVFYRNGQRETVQVTAALNRLILEYARQYDRTPGYVVFAGLTFVPVTRNFLETWGREWIYDIPYYLRYLFNNSPQLNTDRERKEYVVLSEIMPDEINSYSSSFKNLVIESINDKPVYSLDDLDKAFNESSVDYYRLKFMGSAEMLVLDAEAARNRQQHILEKYGIPAEARLEKKI
ncbi:MAG: trypsin-like peptidase domain-containing protein [Planctomycetota bacterium]